MKTKVLALNDRGELTYCSVPPELRGKGRCNHSQHQKDGESESDFINRVNKDYGGKTLKGEMELKPYRMSKEEKSQLPLIRGRKDLADKDNNGGYISLETPLWNDMDINYYAKESGLKVSQINSVLDKESLIVSDVSEEYSKRYPIGSVYLKDKAKEIKDKLDEKIEFSTGVLAMNSHAERNGFEATKDVYVLPYYMRQDPPGEDVKNPLNTLYNLLIVKRKDPDAQQLAYKKLIDNESLDRKKAQRSRGGYKIDSLSTLFKGKSGIMRGYMSGRTIMHSGRAVITSNSNMEYGDLELPPSIAVDIYKPTITDVLKQNGYNEEEIENWFNKYKGDQTKISQSDREDLDEILVWSDQRVIAIRQPSLHASSMLSFRPRVSPNSTIRVNPINFSGYNADIDGDTFTVFAINDVHMSKVANKEIGAHTISGTRMPRAQDKTINRPSKEALWGLLNIIGQRSNK